MPQLHERLQGSRDYAGAICAAHLADILERCFCFVLTATNPCFMCETAANPPLLDPPTTHTANLVLCRPARQGGGGPKPLPGRAQHYATHAHQPPRTGGLLQLLTNGDDMHAMHRLTMHHSAGAAHHSL